MALADSIGLRRQLYDNDPDFAALEREHDEYERRLSELSTAHYLSPEDQLTEHILKKKKLSVRDQMEQILSNYQARRLNDS